MRILFVLVEWSLVANCCSPVYICSSKTVHLSVFILLLTILGQLQASVGYFENLNGIGVMKFELLPTVRLFDGRKKYTASISMPEAAKILRMTSSLVRALDGNVDLVL
ncbi:hypothetical protein FRX31_032263 [Thalictrum thalictroides]|uniref:Uncharacterized protein n=1 Tax=Thalictrum thalictroides TaxID=46969 RepID=A0A7J6V1A1_THATH|nr:hypothetical protein FRX31_032263 [Thalictrum thalictroides]